jgi:hypothetical protein
MSNRIKQLLWAGFFASAVLGTNWFALAEPEPAKLDADKIATAAGTKATTTSDGVVRIGWARTDVEVQVDGMPQLRVCSPKTAA